MPSSARGWTGSAGARRFTLRRRRTTRGQRDLGDDVDAVASTWTVNGPQSGFAKR